MDLGLAGQAHLAFSLLPSPPEACDGRSLLGEGTQAQQMNDAHVMGRWGRQFGRPAPEGHREERCMRLTYVADDAAQRISRSGANIAWPF